MLIPRSNKGEKVVDATNNATAAEKTRSLMQRKANLLEPLFTVLNRLSKDGFRVNAYPSRENPFEITVKLHCTHACGDMESMNDLLGQVGESGAKPCRLCDVNRVPIQGCNKMMDAFTSKDFSQSSLYIDDYYENKVETQLQSVSSHKQYQELGSKFGFNKVSPVLGKNRPETFSLFGSFP